MREQPERSPVPSCGRSAGNGGMRGPGVENVISVIALTLRFPYRKGMTNRNGAPCRGGIGSSFISHASITCGCLKVDSGSSA